MLVRLLLTRPHGRAAAQYQAPGVAGWQNLVIAGGKMKGAGIIGVNLETGRGDRQILFKDKEPDYQVDEWTGRVFNLKNEKELAAFALETVTETDEDGDDA